MRGWWVAATVPWMGCTCGEEASDLAAEVVLQPSEAGLLPPSVQRIRVHPTRSTWLLATGADRSAHVSRDRGRSWAPVLLAEPFGGQPLAVPDPSPRWTADGRLVALREGFLHLSGDGGVTWERRWLGRGLSDLRIDDRQRIVVRQRQPDDWRWLAVQPTDDDVQVTEAGRVRFDDVQAPPLTAQVDGRSVAGPATVTDGGTWIATALGPVFRAEGTSRWELRRSGLEHPVALELQPAPVAPHLSLVDASGRLWASDSFGERWRPVVQGGVRQAWALSAGDDERWLVVRHPFEVALVQGGDVQELGPSTAQLAALLIGAEPARRLDRRRTDLALRLFREPRILDAGSDASGFWLQLGGIDSPHDRWHYAADAGWSSSQSEDPGRVVTLGEEGQRCKPESRWGHAYLWGAPLQPDVTGIAPVTQAGWSSDETLYVAGPSGIWTSHLDDACGAVPPQIRWPWTLSSPGVAIDDDPRWMRQLHVQPASADTPARVLATSPKGLWRGQLPRHGTHREPPAR
ncbi:MAG: hypothetical protein KTR31_38840 [Myxococcales bacterium]|nr:hypothetical protein [Myxococcales bacterium]